MRFEVSKNTFFLKQNVRSTLYFNVIPYFEKNHVQCSAVNTVYRACLSKSKHEEGGGEGGRGINRLNHIREGGGYTKCARVRTWRRRGDIKKLIIRCIRTTWNFNFEVIR